MHVEIHGPSESTRTGTRGSQHELVPNQVEARSAGFRERLKANVIPCPRLIKVLQDTYHETKLGLWIAYATRQSHFKGNKRSVDGNESYKVRPTESSKCGRLALDLAWPRYVGL